jgi:hypothetical protein
LWFRFSKRHFLRLVAALQVPAVNIFEGVRSTGEETVLVLLNRLAYPGRLADLGQKFGRDKHQMSRIFKGAVSFVYQRWHFLLTMAGAAAYLTHERLAEFARAISARGAALNNVWALIDGAIRANARPGLLQQEIYNGWKRLHGLKWQSVFTPDGMIRLLFGPVSARRHDAYMLLLSNLVPDLAHFFHTTVFPAQAAAGLAHHLYVLYGDPAYPLSQYLQCPFRGAFLTAMQEAFNRSMSPVREPVEWGFGKILQQFAYLDFKKNLKIYLSPIGQYYAVGAILTNCHTTMYSSQTSMYFNCPPPSLEQYLS